METSPETQGILDASVAAGAMAGAVALAWRDGELKTAVVAGWRDLEARVPMTRDAIFRIASLTKPITSVAAFMLHEAGRFALDEPIAETWAPEFARMRVMRFADGPLDDAVAAERPITFGDLMTHRSGLTAGGFHSGPLRRAYRETLGPDIDSDLTPDAWIAGLATLPLIDQPGAGFHYGFSTELLGLLIARMEGEPLETVLKRRIFDPLGMADTSFLPSPEKQARAAVMYGFDDAGRLERRDCHPPEEPAFLARRPPQASFVSAGAGLWSTAPDYLRFARLFAEDGAVDGVRLLAPGAVARMTANRLSPEQIAAATMVLGLPAFSGQGFGLGMAVVLDPHKAAATVCRGGVGTVGWPGAYGGWWQADPTNGSTLVFLAHNALDFDKMANGVGLGVYGAITRFHAAETRALA